MYIRVGGRSHSRASVQKTSKGICYNTVVVKTLSINTSKWTVGNLSIPKKSKQDQKNNEVRSTRTNKFEETSNYK